MPLILQKNKNRIKELNKNKNKIRLSFYCLLFVATHVSILTSDTSSKPYGSPSPAYGTLRYRVPCGTPASSVHGLSPVTFSAQDGLTRPVSYYAFFKGWLLLSQPPGCLGLPTSFTT